MPVPYNDWLGTLRRKATLRERAGLRRSATPRGAAIDLAGNDYLGLSRHPAVLGAAASALAEHGLGATGSRLVRGTTALHSLLEVALAEFIGTRAALVYSSGYLANLGAIRALAGLSPRTRLISDAHNHASMIDGCRLSGAETVVYRHGDVADAESLLEPGRPNVILTESVFSVDGDLAPLTALHDLARAHGALLLVDDAHGLGVNDAARGLAASDHVVITATLSKALGGAGGVVAGPSAFIEHLVDTSRTFIFDTALPPAVAAGVLAALDIAHEADDLRTIVRTRAARLAALADASPAGQDAGSSGAALPGGETVSGVALPGGVAGSSGVALPGGAAGSGGVALPGGAAGSGGVVVEGGAAGGLLRPAGAVVSLRAEHAHAAVAWQAACRSEGVAVGCFRPPSTPDGSSRLRLTVNAGVPEADFDRAIEVIEKCRP